MEEIKLIRETIDIDKDTQVHTHTFKFSDGYELQIEGASLREWTIPSLLKKEGDEPYLEIIWKQLITLKPK